MVFPRECSLLLCLVVATLSKLSTFLCHNKGKVVNTFNAESAFFLLNLVAFYSTSPCSELFVASRIDLSNMEYALHYIGIIIATKECITSVMPKSLYISLYTVWKHGTLPSFPVWPCGDCQNTTTPSC